MSKIKDLALMTGLDKVYGCGALNWDIFFEVPSLEVLKGIPGINFEVKPGAEVAIDRKSCLRILEELEKRGKRVFSCGGGSSANTMFALSLLGAKASFIGVCGKDEFGDSLLKELSDAGVDLSLVERYGETSIALIILDASRDRFIIVSPGSSESFLKRENFISQVVKRLKSEVALLHLSSFASLEGQNFLTLFLDGLSPKQREDFFVSFDPGQVYVEKGRYFLLDFLRHMDILFITEGELLASGINPAEIFELSILVVFLRMGKHGAKAITKEFELSHPAIPPERIVDNTGAGDYFNAGVLASILKGDSLDNALFCGVRLASFSLSDYGRRGILFIK